MKLLLYLDKQIFFKKPDELIKEILKHPFIKGIEVSIDIDNNDEKEYLKKLASLCNEKKLILQIHAHIIDDVKKQLDFYNEVAVLYNNNLNILNHPLESDNIYLAQEKTNTLFVRIISYIKEQKYNITFSVENLSARANTVRLSKDLLLPILNNNEKLHFTYNIGNEIRDYGKVININEVFLKHLNNVHIYSYDFKNIHKAVVLEDEHFKEIIRVLNYLKQNGYTDPLVLDYDFALLGSNDEERLTNYFKSAEIINKNI